MVQQPLVTLFDAQIMTHYVYLTTPDCDGGKSCGLICFWFDH